MCLCAFVKPSFFCDLTSNGEGQRGYIEDLNDFVSLHIKRTTDRMGRTVQALSALASDLVDLLAMGMLTLNAKLADLSDERLLVRIVSGDLLSFSRAVHALVADEKTV
jgi:ABC-type transporter Mla subunit MlaD